jgi:hypothetical protein
LDFSLPNKEEEGLALSLLWFLGARHTFGLSLAFPFVFHAMVPAISFYWIFLYPIKKRGQKHV